MKEKILVLLACASLPCACRFFLPYDDLEKAIQARMDALNVKGLAAQVMHGDDVLWSGDFGYEDVESGRPVDAESIFMSASVSKIIVSLAFMQCYEAGWVELDADVNVYLPFRVANPRYPALPITPRMLLTHTSSLIDNEEFVKYAEARPLDFPFTPDELSDDLEDYLVEGGDRYDATSNFGDWIPGGRESYSDIGVCLLAVIVENVSGELFTDFTQNNIFTPLGMGGTWDPNDVDPGHMATPYGPTGAALPFHRCDYYPAGNFYSTVADFSRLVSLFASGGAYRGVRLLREDTVAMMLEPAIGRQAFIWYKTSYRICGDELMEHDGYLPGTRTFCDFNPVNRIGIIYFSNGDFAHPFAAYEILEALYSRGLSSVERP
jgi:CubicO group peptidase (beta-lactamase class C family)